MNVSVLVWMTQIPRGKRPDNSIAQFATTDLSELPGSHLQSRTRRKPNPIERVAFGPWFLDRPPSLHKGVRFTLMDLDYQSFREQQSLTRKVPWAKLLAQLGKKSGVLQVPRDNIALAAKFLIREPVLPRLRHYDATFGLFDDTFLFFACDLNDYHSPMRVGTVETVFRVWGSFGGWRLDWNRHSEIRFSRDRGRHVAYCNIVSRVHNERTLNSFVNVILITGPIWCPYHLSRGEISNWGRSWRPFDLEFELKIMSPLSYKYPGQAYDRVKF